MAPDAAPALDRTGPGIQKLEHVVVLMMENRSFDHMLGALQATHPNIDGLDGTQSNPDTTGALIQVQPLAQYQGQLDPDPDHHFPAVDLQIFGGVATAQNPDRQPNMQGFIKSYWNQQRDVDHSHKILYHFSADPPNNLPVLHKLATEFAVFNRWFASIPGPTLCNRAFAHYGTSFGQVGMDLFYAGKKYKSIYERMLAAGHSSKLFYFDEASSSLEVVNILQNQPSLFGTFDDFKIACDRNLLPEYSFIEPNYKDHDDPDGSGAMVFACDQHPDGHILAGEQFIATVYNSIRQNPSLWPNTALLIVYDEHGGIYDHVPPPACTPDDCPPAQPKDTGTLDPFYFNRLGVRVPAILVSPWVEPGSVINDVFDHASIPATVHELFLNDGDTQRSAREHAARNFLNYMTRDTFRTDCPDFSNQKSE